MLWLLTQIQTVSFADLAPLLPRISPERRERITQMRVEASRVESALAELLLRHALKEECGVDELPPVYTTGRGKPYFQGHPELQFNLSHCKLAVACALDRSELGVDVQECRALLRRFGRKGEDRALPAIFRVLSDPERAWVLAGGPYEQDRRFTAVWTCKEAYGKAVGRGILYQLSGKSFLPAEEPWQQYGYTFQHYDLGDAFATLCAARTLPVRILTAEAFLREQTEETT